MSARVEIFEVGPRDGLQNERVILSTADKLEFVRRLLGAGLKSIEVGAFVRPDRVPQMADSDALFAAIGAAKSADFWALVPNEKGLDRALAAGCTRIALFSAATESFAKKNIGMTIDESFAEYARIFKRLKETKKKVRVRGYISTALGCPFEGTVAPRKALKVLDRFLKLGVEQVSIGDTIGVATPKQIDAVFRPALKSASVREIAGHFHDTRGTALANALRALDLGVRTLDSSAGGLGGCPFAPGAAGNLATEDLVYMLDGMGVKTGVRLEALAATSLWLAQKMNRALSSKYLLTCLASKSGMGLASGKKPT